MITYDAPMKLSNIGNGELERQFMDELEKVFKNIMDLETTDDTREINIKIGVKPTGENRNVMQIGFALKRKDAPIKPYVTGAVFDKENGKIVMKEFRTPTQKPIPFETVKNKEGE